MSQSVAGCGSAPAGAARLLHQFPEQNLGVPVEPAQIELIVVEVVIGHERRLLPVQVIGKKVGVRARRCAIRRGQPVVEAVLRLEVFVPRLSRQADGIGEGERIVSSLEREGIKPGVPAREETDQDRAAASKSK